MIFLHLFQTPFKLIYIYIYIYIAVAQHRLKVLYGEPKAPTLPAHDGLSLLARPVYQKGCLHKLTPTCYRLD
jgi:hypothetical protein